MSKVSSVVCDGCGKHKGEGNHWTVVAHYVEKTLVGRDGRVLAIALAEGEHRLIDSKIAPNVYDVCGSACEQKIIARLRKPAADIEAVKEAEAFIAARHSAKILGAPL